MPKSQTTAHEPTKKNESDFGAHSNSPESTKTFNIAEKYTDPLFPGIHKVSWDRMTIVGNLDPNRAQSLITAFCNEPNVVIRPDRSSRAFHATIMESVDCRFNMDGPSKNARNFRLDFNPNNAPEEFMPYYQAHILPCLTDIGFSRLDIAIDTIENLEATTWTPGTRQRRIPVSAQAENLKQYISEYQKAKTISESMTRRISLRRRRTRKLNCQNYGALSFN